LQCIEPLDIRRREAAEQLEYSEGVVKLAQLLQLPKFLPIEKERRTKLFLLTPSTRLLPLGLK